MSRQTHPKVKIIMELAKDEARALNYIHVRPEHIVLGMLLHEDNESVKALKELGVDTFTLYDTISDYLRKTDLTPRLLSNKKDIPFAKECNAIFMQVDNECDKRNDTMVKSIHVLLSILASKCEVNRFLADVGVDYNSFNFKLNEMKNKPQNSHLDDDIDDQSETDKIKKSKKKGETKTPVLDNFCRDVTKAAERNEIDPVVGRSNEIKRVSQILSRRKKNNPILIGEPGVGKTSIVEGLAILIKNGTAPRTLLNKKLYVLDLAAIVAGTKYRGQFEERMKAIIEECRANPEIILFLDEIHTLVGAGNASGSLDASNIFKPALARGELQCIGATTLSEYREHIEKDGALTRRFQEVLVNEPTIEETIIILNNIKDKYEKHHKVIYTPEAIEECVKLSHRYIMERCMPDKAIDVMDEAGAATNVIAEKPENIKELEAKKAGLTARKKDVVLKQRYEEAAKLRDEERIIEEQLIKEMTSWQEALDKDINTVGVENITEVISMMTGIPLTKISVQETKKLVNMDKELIGKVIGQDDAIQKVVRAIKRNRIGIKDKNKPVGTFIFLGPTGVGKTYLAKLLAENMFGDSDALIRLDMSEFMEKFSVSRLVGPPPGYVGYEQGGQLTEKVRKKPHCVILFDEIEKAHEDVFNILLQLLDEGMLTDGLGRKVNFKNALIILTSNIGVSELNLHGKSLGFETPAMLITEESKTRSIIEKALKKKFKPEFLNRIDEAIFFKSLSKENIHEIVKIEMVNLEKRILEMGYKVKVDDAVVNFIGNIGYSAEYGARPLNRAIQHHIDDKIADEILGGDIKEGDTIKISFSTKDNEVVVSSSTKKVKDVS